MTRERSRELRGGPAPRDAPRPKVSRSAPRPPEPSREPASPEDQALFGRNPVLELLRGGSRRVEEIAIMSEGRGPALHDLLNLARRQGVKISFRTRDQLTAIAGDPHHQGVVARVAGPATPPSKTC